MRPARALIALLAGLLAVPGFATDASARGILEVLSIRMVTPQVDTSTGWADVVVELHLRNVDGMPEVWEPSMFPYVLALGGAPKPGEVSWRRMARISGTDTEGVFQGSVRVTPAWEGTYTVDNVVGQPVTGVHFTISGGGRWAVTAIRTPVKVVQGQETWRPRARITVAATGAPVHGARVLSYPFVPVLTEPLGTPSDATGLWVSPRLERADIPPQLAAYGGRGSRGWSLQGGGCSDLTVKLQATAKYPASPLRPGAVLGVTGNVFPAPVIMRAGGQIVLQRQTAAGWETVAGAQPRDNGRYTLAWLPPAPGAYTLRVRWPGTGSAEPCSPQSIGTSLAATTIQVG